MTYLTISSTLGVSFIIKVQKNKCWQWFVRKARSNFAAVPVGGRENAIQDCWGRLDGQESVVKFFKFSVRFPVLANVANSDYIDLKSLSTASSSYKLLSNSFSSYSSCTNVKEKVIPRAFRWFWIFARILNIEYWLIWHKFFSFKFK